jgi:ribosomal protein L11 methyltransferase
MDPQKLPRFHRLTLTVPELIAEPYGAALVELGAGAVEQRPGPSPGFVNLLLSQPEEEPVDAWVESTRMLFAAFAEELSLPEELFEVTTELVECDYHAPWLSRLTQIRISEDLVMAPVADTTPIPSGADRIVYEPHPSFGDGTHVTTRLAAAAVARVCQSQKGCSVLDVGTGTGILSLVAHLRGAGRILGIDVNPDSVAIARHNAELNGADCEFSTEPLEAVEEQFDLVVANLEPRTQVEVGRALVPRVGQRGRLLLTGFLIDQARAIAAPLLEEGFALEEFVEEEDYALLWLQRR